jgi:hypothetical protein
MTEPTGIATIYLAAWNEPDDEARRAMLQDGWTVDASYVDPMMAADGREQIASMIGQARASFPGCRFSLRGSPDGYGDRVRFSWSLGPDEAPDTFQGTDIVRLGADGRIREVVGFLDRVPA